MTDQTRIVQPGQMEAPVGEIRYLFLPPGDLFARRAERLRSLAHDHPFGAYLAFVALIADAQDAVLKRFPSLSVPRNGNRIPLPDIRSWSRETAWLRGLQMILRLTREADLPPAARETVAGLLEKREADLEETADMLLDGELSAISPHELPFVAAALQVYWVHMASALEESTVTRREDGGLCPVCASSPMVGKVRGSGPEQGLRYLVCSLCASEWHMVRLTCSACGSTDKLSYYSLAGSNGAVQAETCDNCGSYLKLLYLGKDPYMDATADDLGTLALDILMDKEGKVRRGPNLFFHPGNPL